MAEKIAIERNDRKEKVGVVVSNKMAKSITVAVQRQIIHGKYGKYLKKTSV